MEAQELEEIEIIQEFMPTQLSDDEAKSAVEAAIAETGAESLRDMGKVMGRAEKQISWTDGYGKSQWRDQSRVGRLRHVFIRWLCRHLHFNNVMYICGRAVLL